MHRAWAVTLALTAGCFTKPSPPGGAPAAWHAGYEYRRAITVTRPTDPPEILEVFPLSVVLKEDVPFSTHSLGRNDLAFTTEDGVTELPYEVVAYDNVVTDLEAWVRTEMLPPGTSTLFLYYGGVSSFEDPARVWDTAAAVWHMAGSGLTESDSSGQVAGVQSPSAQNQPSPIEGILGSSRYYDGDDYMCTDRPNLPIGASSFSLSMWVRQEGTNGAYDAPFYRGGDGDNIGVTFELGTAPWEAFFNDDGPTPVTGLGLGSTVSDQFRQLALTFDRETLTATSYSDGVDIDTVVVPAFDSISDLVPTCLGSVIHKFTGTLDEVRLYRAAKSKAYLQAEFANIARRASFMTIGGEETRP